MVQGVYIVHQGQEREDIEIRSPETASEAVFHLKLTLILWGMRYKCVLHPIRVRGALKICGYLVLPALFSVKKGGTWSA